MNRAIALALVLAGCQSSAPVASGPSSQLRSTTRIAYYHTAVGAGPTVITRDDGSVLDERRYEPFGAGIGAIDYALDPHNVLNKESDVDTRWSDHGARWMAPETGRWLTPDPPVKAPDAGFMTRPWDLHPYQYVAQNPVMFWDPDGRERFETEARLAARDARARYEREHAAAVAKIGGATPGVTPPPGPGVSATDVVASLDWNPRLTQSQAAFLDPFIARGLKALEREATIATARFAHDVLKTRNGHNNAADAFRHAYFSFRLTQEEGDSTAHRWGDAHEVSVPNPLSERAMDLWNNATGRRLAAGNDGEAYDVIHDAYRKGLLLTTPIQASPDPKAAKPYEYPLPGQ